MYSGGSLVGGRRSRSRTAKGRTNERKRKEPEENENKKTDEVSEARTAIDKKESASAQFKQMRA